MADLAGDMAAAGFPIRRTAIDNTRRQELRLGGFASLTDTEVDFLRWALDRWPDANFQPLAVAGSPAAEIIEREQARGRRAEGVAGEVSGNAPADANASQGRPPYSRKDALRTVPQGGGAPSTNGLNNHDKSNASLGLPKPIEGAQVRTMGIVRSRGTEHSRKPEELYTEIERLFEGPRCEFFARERRPVWDSWGLKAAKFDTDSLPSTLTAKE
jgi:hypothetical protein